MYTKISIPTRFTRALIPVLVCAATTAAAVSQAATAEITQMYANQSANNEYRLTTEYLKTKNLRTMKNTHACDRRLMKADKNISRSCELGMLLK